MEGKWENLLLDFCLLHLNFCIVPAAKETCQEKNWQSSSPMERVFGCAGTQTLFSVFPTGHQHTYYMILLGMFAAFQVFTGTNWGGLRQAEEARTAAAPKGEKVVWGSLHHGSPHK